MGGALKPRIIICDTCGKEVVTTGGHTLRCKECARKVVNAQRRKARKYRREMNGDYPGNDLIRCYDSPEEIKKCLSCEKPACRNCLWRKEKGGRK